MRKVKIGNRLVGDGEPIFIVAEAGVNHNGSLKKAIKLIDAAVDAHADAIKFQTFRVEDLLLRNAEKPKYQQEKKIADSQYEMLKKLELTEKEHCILSEYAGKKGVIFLSTPYDIESVELLGRIGVEAYKLSSIEIVNHPFIDYVLRKGKPVIMSTGLSTEDEIDEAVSVVEATGYKHNLILLHCHFNYPTKLENVNMKVMTALRKRYNVSVGFSDHTQGIIASMVAASLGARVIEKHLTLNKNLPGPDHKASVEPDEFKNMVKGIRDVEKILGSPSRVLSEQELSNMASRRSVILLTDVKKGEVINEKVLGMKRPGTGIWPTYKNLSQLIGKKAKTRLKKDTIIEWEMVE